MSKKKKQVKKTKKITLIVCLALAALFIAFAIFWIARPKNNGIYTWYGTKMKADHILRITFNVDGTDKTYDVPFSEYRGMYLYYKSIIPNVIQNEDSATYTTDAQKNRALKEITEDKLVEYYSLVSIADSLGIGLTDKDRAAYFEQYQKNIAEYCEQYGVDEKTAEKKYESALLANGITTDYFELMYYRTLLTSRVKSALGGDIEKTANDEYFAYEQIYISYTKGDSVSGSAANEKIFAAKAELDAGADFSEVAKKYGDTQSSGTTYFDGNLRVVGTTNAVGETTADMVRALDFGEYSSVMSGFEDDETYGFYMIIRRVKITADFICSDAPTATEMFAHPYYGASEYSAAYMEYSTLLEAYEQNKRVVPVSQKVFDRIAVNTLY